MLEKFMERSVVPCLEKAGIEFVRVGRRDIVLSSTDMTTLRSLLPEKRWPVGDLTLFGETTVFVTGDKEIVGTLKPWSNSGELIITYFMRRK